MEAKKKFRTQSLASSFAERFGGKWKYDGNTTWWCDDDARHISRVAMNIDWNDEEEAMESKFCMYFSDGRTPEWI